MQGKDEYPTTIAECMELLESREDPLKRGSNTPVQQQWMEDAEGVSCAQHGYEEKNEKVVQASEQDGPANHSSLVLKSSRRNRGKKKNKVKFEQDAAGNPVIPHQSHWTERRSNPPRGALRMYWSVRTAMVSIPWPTAQISLWIGCVKSICKSVRRTEWMRME